MSAEVVVSAIKEAVPFVCATSAVLPSICSSSAAATERSSIPETGCESRQVRSTVPDATVQSLIEPSREDERIWRPRPRGMREVRGLVCERRVRGLLPSCYGVEGRSKDGVRRDQAISQGQRTKRDLKARRRTRADQMRIDMSMLPVISTSLEGNWRHRSGSAFYHWHRISAKNTRRLTNLATVTSPTCPLQTTSLLLDVLLTRRLPP